MGVRQLNRKKYVRQLGVTIPGQPKATHQVSLPDLVYFIYATAKEDLKVRPTLNKVITTIFKTPVLI